MTEQRSTDTLAGRELSLTAQEHEAWQARLQAAWHALPLQTQQQLQPLLDDGQAELAKYLATGVPPAAHTHGTLRMKSYLEGDREGHLARMNSAVAPALTLTVDKEGEILGTAKYEQLDPGWELIAGTVWLENLLHKHPFPAGTPTVRAIGNKVSLALLSDWGTGPFGAGEAPPLKIAKAVRAHAPDLSVHLGDVYYAGTSGEEKNNLLANWPAGSAGSYALNSNHDMYSAGGPYFTGVVGTAPFEAQAPWSFWAVENDNWLIIGLDSAYHASPLGKYMNGTLGKENTQTEFLKTLAGRAGAKKIILLTHHNPIPIGGAEPEAPLTLYTDVMSCFPPNEAPAFWYYGHVHVGAVYQPGGATLFRCLGHGALPWGYASALAGSKQVEWFEQRHEDPAFELRVLNGWVLLQLDGPALTETFYDENGGLAWTKTHTG